MSWITNIANSIEKAFTTVRPALQGMIPPLLLICEVKSRPGLSAIALTSAIIRRLPEAGLDTGVNPDGTPNKRNKLIRIMCEEIVREFKDNAKITCAIQGGDISSTGMGVNEGGPMVVKSINNLPINIYGLLE